MKNGAVLLMWIVIVLYVVVVVGLYIHVFLKYGSEPLTEIPAWAYIFLRGCAK